MIRHQFKIQHNKKIYKCERYVFGTGVLKQTILVDGCGSKPDFDRYGPNFHPFETMAELARIIAHELVQEFENKKQIDK